MSFYDSLSAKIYLMEKHIKENESEAEHKPWYLLKDGVFSHLKIGFYKILLALARVGLIIRGRPASNFTVFTRAGKEGLYICNYSYCYYKDFHHKTRNKTIATIIAATILLSLIISLIFPGEPRVKAATYSFSQTNWSGGADGGIYPNHTSNQSGWTKYSAKDANIVASATNLTLANATSNFLDTTDLDFNAGNYGTPAVTRSNGAGSVILIMPPDAPTGLSATAGNAQAVMNWTAPASNGGSAITSYKVYRGTTSNGETLLSLGGCSGLGNVLTCADTGLTNDTTYYYKVSAVNSVGESSQSAEASVAPNFCGAPISDFTFGGFTYNQVGVGSQCWLDRNLGATRVASSSIDSQAYGYLYQWGRLTDGHQITTSGTTTTLSSTDVPGNANFIYGMGSPYDWRSPQNDNLWQGVNGINNPCPSGYRLPTQPEWSTLVSAAGITNSATAYSSALKLPLAGYRNFGTAALTNQGSYGYYWSSSPFGASAYSLYFDSSSVNPALYNSRAYGFSVRCLKN